MSDMLAFHAVFSGEVIYWRGPSPYHYVPAPAAESDEIRASAATTAADRACATRPASYHGR